jgi:hypothetical protein
VSPNIAADLGQQANELRVGTSFLAITDRRPLDGDRLLQKIAAKHWPESHQRARHQDFLRISRKSKFAGGYYNDGSLLFW